MDACDGKTVRVRGQVVGRLSDGGLTILMRSDLLTLFRKVTQASNGASNPK